MNAYREANEVIGVSKRVGLIEVVYTPDQAALNVAPCTEILDVKIANSERARSFGEIAADIGPELSPAIVGGAEEREDGRFHGGVLQAEIFFDNRRAIGEPPFIAARGLNDIHSDER